MAADTSSITEPTTSADVASARPMTRQAPALTDNAKNQPDASALSVVTITTTTQQALAPNAGKLPDIPVTAIVAALVGSSTPVRTSGRSLSTQAVKQEALADDIELTDAVNLPSGVPTEDTRDEPGALVPVAETQDDTDWRSLPFAFYDMLTDAFEVLESIALDEPRLICRLCYDT